MSRGGSLPHVESSSESQKSLEVIAGTRISQAIVHSRQGNPITNDKRVINYATFGRK